MVAKRRIQLTGHILRLPENRPAKVVMNWISHGGERPEVDERRLGEQQQLFEEEGQICIRLLKLLKVD